jgi:Holliday junction resolvasome RuvABC endonuclease subunit
MTLLDDTTALDAAAGLAPPYRVLGIDLSMTSTGLAYIDGPHINTTAVRSKPTDGTVTEQRLRLRGIVAAIWAYIHQWTVSPDLAVIEGPSYGSQGKGTWDRAGLWWMVVDELLAQGVRLAVVAPTARCRYATGKGNAAKDLVLAETVKRFGVVVGNDEADALVLAAMGRDWLGQPIAKVPETHRAALAKVAWPEQVAS